MKKLISLLSGNNMILIIASFLFLFSACKDEEDDPIFSQPTISIQGEELIELKRGAPIEVDLMLNAEGGNKELLVYFDGGLLEIIELEKEITSYTYSSQSVPSTAEEGQEFEYEFSLVNTQDLESEKVKLTVSTLLYDIIQVGGTQLYEVIIPDDGIIETENYKFAKNRKYYIGRHMLFQPGTSLTVEEGVHLYVNADFDEPIFIEFEVGAEVHLVGTATNPVVITSSNVLTGEPQPGDWGRFNIYGDGEGSNSGKIHYLRMEYPGSRAFRLSDVGSGTSISHIQVFMADGEGIMPTSGDVNMKYIVATDCRGGAFRLGNTYSGKIQFALSWLSDQYDSNEELTIREEASPVISNVTLIGPGVDASNTHGLRMRAASSGKVYNAIIAEFPRRGIRLNDEVVVTDLEGPTVFAYSYIFNVPTDPYRDDTDNGNPFQGYMDGETLVNPFFNNILGFDEDGEPILDIIAGIGVGDFLPDAEKASDFNPSSLDDFFDNAPYVGAFRNQDDDWTVGWVKNPDGSIR